MKAGKVFSCLLLLCQNGSFPEFSHPGTDPGHPAQWQQAELARKIHTSAPYVNRVTRNKENIVNKTFLAMMEGLGYDVELHYVRREN